MSSPGTDTTIFADNKRVKKIQGIVLEALPNGQFKVEIDLEGKHIIRCYLNGKMRQNQIKVLVGDKVDLEFPKSLHINNVIGRITYRIK